MIILYLRYQLIEGKVTTFESIQGEVIKNLKLIVIISGLNY